MFPHIPMIFDIGLGLHVRMYLTVHFTYNQDKHVEHSLPWFKE